MKLLVVRTSSMGDVIHAFPAITDLQRQRPDLAIDWVVEEGFADLPPLHPAVRKVHRVALRRWRKAPLSRSNWRELGAARRAIAAERYDAVLDLQGLLKSAWIARWARAPVSGFDRASAREPLAARLYQSRHAVDRTPHAIERTRLLASLAFGYRVATPPEFGLRRDLPRPDWLTAAPVAVLLHATSRAEKHWPDEHWTALARALAARGFEPVWPWGSADESAHAARLVAASGVGRIAPRLRLAQAAALLQHAALVVGVDTGLMHLAAAFDRPTAAIFTATPPARFGPYWTPRAANVGGVGEIPPPDAVLDALAAVGALTDAATA